MADKAKDDAIRSNLSDETFWGFVEELDALTYRQASATSAVRNCRKRAKAAGIDLQILDLKLGEKRLDPDRRREMLATGARYETLLGMATTLDLSKAIQAEMDFSEPDQATKDRIVRRDAIQEGRDACKAGEPAGNNRFDAGTVAYIAWATGWGDENLRKQANTDPEAPPRRRGRPRTAAAGEPAPETEVASSPQEETVTAIH